MNKTTAGTLILDGNNTYTGNTKVSAGTLQFTAGVAIASSVIDVYGGTLDVTAFGGPGYTVGGGVTIKGNGTVNGSLNVLGTLSAGESPGQLTVNGNATLSGNDLVEIAGGAPGTGYDQLVVNDGISSPGTVTLGGTLTVSNTYAPPAPGPLWIVLNNTSNPLSGTFSTVTGLPAGWDVVYNVDYATSNLTPGSGNDVAITTVPEPATLAMLIFAAGLCLMFKRRSK